MERKDILSLLITFVVGIISGAFLYTTHFSKIISPDRVATQADTEEFTIIGEAYGSCTDVCPAFQLLKDGSYRYQYVVEVGQPKTIKEGTLPIDIQNAVKKHLIQAALVKQSQPIEPTDCNSYQSGIDVRYKITLKGAEYELDSCGTNVDGNGPLWESLTDVWTYFGKID